MQNHLKMQDPIISRIRGSPGVTGKRTVMERVGLGRSLVDPILDCFHFVSREWVALRGHLPIGVCAGNILIHKTFGTIPHLDDRAGFAAFKGVFQGVEPEFAPFFPRLAVDVALCAVFFKDGPDIRGIGNGRRARSGRFGSAGV